MIQYMNFNLFKGLPYTVVSKRDKKVGSPLVLNTELYRERGKPHGQCLEPCLFDFSQ